MMYTRSAIFEGTINPGCEEEFDRALVDSLLPAWKQMLHAVDVRLYRPVRQDEGTRSIFLVQEIDYPSLEAIDEALSSSRRQAAMAAMAAVQHLYTGKHYHYVYKKITGDQE